MSWLFLIVVIPMASSAVLFLGGRATDAWGHLLGCAAPIASFVLGVIAFVQLQGTPSHALHDHVFTWISAGPFQVNYDMLFDPLSALFVLLITGVGSLIHVYSIGYMEHDARRRRFFAQMNLFVASMLLLVMSADYLSLFLGWEGVGLASYLLIGFWQQRDSAAVAAKKAFVVNRVGDMGMSLAIMLMFASFGTMSFSGVSAGMSHTGGGPATALGLLLLLGACGKSAQVPLQSWLLDAMEGPTPVSALIHAATMVTAGVYLVVRSSFIYAHSVGAQTAVVIVGLITLLWGAIIGCAKDDIKRALAGSTMSQIGYMMLAAGIGPAGYAFAIFHLLTHGFFKANLFLGSGSIMHAMNDEVDMRRYGALARIMPVTFLTFGCGYLAIIGFPGFSGYWSKGHIVEAAFTDSSVIGAGAMIGAGITAFYMTRLMIMTYAGERRWAKGAHPHESKPIMTVPLIILAALSAIGGLLLLDDWIVRWLQPTVGPEGTHALPIPSVAITLIELLAVAIGIVVAWFTVGTKEVPVLAPRRVSPVTKAARANLYGDAFNETVFMRPGQYLTRWLVFFDNTRLDGLVNGLSALVGGSSSRFRRWQTGFVRSYALSMLGGSIVVVVAVLAVKLG
ncbi:MAG TPA: NADH-quinone oxidoreductase subunit L [Nocardioidaceae bacterium]|nr:NADH-quinone oxidoreductase subunit L [Nocardioidaceae bacterium]